MINKQTFTVLSRVLCLSFAAIFLLTSCSTTQKSSRRTRTVRSVQGGGYYLDDGPMAEEPEDLMSVPDAVPRVETISRSTSKPYVVFGRTYTPMTDLTYYRKQGVGSWYGRKFHGQKTSSGEIYDMFGMTAAHPTLPIPSYARVTSLETGKQVIVRVNDRGPFLSDRIIDLSYTAAYKLGYLNKGSARVEVELLLPDEIAMMNGEKTTYSKPTQTRPAPVAASAQPMAAADDGEQLASGYYLQLGAYQEISHAQQIRAKYALQWANRVPKMAVAPIGGYYKLFAGPFNTRQEAVALADEMKSMGTNAFVVKR